MLAIPSLHIIATRRMGGAERWFVRFLRAMQRRGETVQALVRTGSDLAQHHLAGIPTETLPFRTVWDPLSRWQVSHYARQSQTPIVQTYMGRATRLTHIRPNRGQIHIARLGGYYRLPAFQHAHAWVGNTRSLCDWMIQGGFPANRVFHITNFADPAVPADPVAIAAIRAQLQACHHDWLILHPARFVGFKGHANLLNAFARLPVELNGRRLRLILLGDGPLRATLETQVQQLGIADRIVWAGWQQDPSQWLHAADMVVMPSRDEETLGNVILEAWAYGKPLVATAFRGARELIEPDKDALLAPCDNPIALAEALKQMITLPELRTALVEAGSKKVTQHFSEASILDQYCSLYAKLTQSG